jgi:hypothetical protein
MTVVPTVRIKNDAACSAKLWLSRAGRFSFDEACQSENVRKSVSFGDYPTIGGCVLIRDVIGRMMVAKNMFRCVRD